MKIANNLSRKSFTTNVHYSAKQQTHQRSAKRFLVYYTKPFWRYKPEGPYGVTRIFH